MPRLEQRYDPACPVDQLSEHPDNPRRGNEAAIEASMEAHGFYGAVLAQASTGRIIAGNHRTRAARRLGEATVPVLFVDVDDDQARRLLLVDNRTNDLAGYDDAELARLLEDLAADGGGLVGTGFSDEDLAVLLAELEQGQEPADDPPIEPAPQVTERGDVWQLGAHRLLCGDCRDPADVDRLLDGAVVNVAVTSPPYADRRPYDPSSGFRPIPPDEYVDWFEPVAANVAAHLADDGSWFVNIKPGADGCDTELYVLDLVIAHVRRWGWHFATEFCWERNGVPKHVTQRFKNQFEPVYQFARGRWKMRADNVRHYSDTIPVPLGPGLGTRAQETYQGKPGSGLGRSASYLKGRHGAPKTALPDAQGQPYGGDEVSAGLAYPGNRLPPMMPTHEAVGHAAAYPVGLPSFFVRAYSDPGDVVYDPFTGSGSTILAAHQTGRIGYGLELSAGYCDMVCLRFERATGIVPRRNGEDVSFTALAPVPADTRSGD